MNAVRLFGGSRPEQSACLAAFTPLIGGEESLSAYSAGNTTFYLSFPELSDLGFQLHTLAVFFCDDIAPTGSRELSACLAGLLISGLPACSAA
jgi:hypothetical protein